jgi:peptidoglycan/LPS O-acetylase OafA/YrhL
MKDRLDAITAYKGIAIMMVIMVHSAIRFDIPNSLSFITRFGQMGCQIFFVISGFSLMLSFDRHQYSLK